MFISRPLSGFAATIPAKVYVSVVYLILKETILAKPAVRYTSQKMNDRKVKSFEPCRLHFHKPIIHQLFLGIIHSPPAAQQCGTSSKGHLGKRQAVLMTENDSKMI